VGGACAIGRWRDYAAAYRDNDYRNRRRRRRRPPARTAELLGFERQDQARIATAVSEIARNAFLYAGGGRVEFVVEIKSPQLFRIRISEEGKGIAILVFTLAIPAGLGGAAAPAAELSKKRVLIVDDDDTFPILRQIISNEPRYEVPETNNGSDGLHLAKDEHPDVIVRDLQMPNVDGFTVLQQLNADQHTSMIPVVVATSLAVNAELRARLPVGRRLISKNVISRENVSLFLRDAVGSQVFP
jgi:CheY-like chemotaxis protein